MEVLTEEVRQLSETVQSQAGQLEEMGRRVMELEEAGSEQVEADSGPAFGNGAVEGWSPPKRGHELPDAGVVTLERHPDEEHAFRPAAELVAEWRGLRTGGANEGSGMERARSDERRWELEVELTEDYHLKLPPEKEPLQGSRRDDHLRWRREALAQARSKRIWSERWRAVLTLGLWRG